MHRRNAIIIGAGTAGLTAANYLLTETDIRPIVLERKNSVDDLPAMTFDDTPKIFYGQKIFPYPTVLNFDTLKNFGLGDMFSIGASFLKTKFTRREEITLEDLLINRFGQKFGEKIFGNCIMKIFGRTPREIPAENINDLSPEKLFPQFGNNQSLEKLADEIKRLGGEVLFNTDVKNFRIDGKKIRSVVAENPAGKLTFPADYFLSGMPLTELADALDEKILPDRPRQIAKSLPYRDLIVANLRADKISVDGEIYVAEPSIKLARMKVSDMQIVAEYFCREGDELWQMSESDFIKSAVDELSKIGIIDASNVRSAAQIKIPKAHPLQFDTYENISELRATLDEIQNLYRIGRNGLHDETKSILSAREAVSKISAEKTFHG